MILDKGILTKHENDKKMLRKNDGSWTINMSKLWNHLGSIQKVIYITQSGKYEIDFTTALIHGVEETFNGERKLVVPVRLWNFTKKGAENGKVCHG